MRISVLIFAVTVIVADQKYVFAQTKDSTVSAKPSPANSIEDNEIQNLKDKIATKVAQLREKNNKAVSGFVTKISSNQLTIINENKEEYQIKLDDTLTKYYQITGVQKKEIKSSDIKPDSFIIVTGVANDNMITANIIYIDEKFLTKSGKVTEIDKDDFSVKIATTDKDTYTISIETSTRQMMVNSKTLDIERMGFSKIKEGDTVHFIVKKTGKEKDNTYSAFKILLIPQEYFMQ